MAVEWVRDMDQHEQTPAAAFNGAAPDYDASFTRGTLAGLQRAAVRVWLEALLAPGMRVLELGCGTGEDALWLARLGIRVVASDASEGMLAVTRAKAGRAGVTDRVACLRLDLEDRDGLAALDRPYDAAFADFGPLNCLADRRPLASALARLLPVGAPLVLVMLGTLCPWEIAWYLAHGAPRTALRRLADGRPAAVGGGGSTRVWYPPPRQLRRELAPHFSLSGIEGLGVLLPPPTLEHLARRGPRLVQRLARVERRLARRWPCNRLGDHTVLVFRRVRSEGVESEE